VPQRATDWEWPTNPSRLRMVPASSGLCWLKVEEIAGPPLADRAHELLVSDHVPFCPSPPGWRFQVGRLARRSDPARGFAIRRCPRPRGVSMVHPSHATITGRCWTRGRRSLPDPARANARVGAANPCAHTEDRPPLRLPTRGEDAPIVSVLIWAAFGCIAHFRLGRMCPPRMADQPGERQDCRMRCLLNLPYLSLSGVAQPRAPKVTEARNPTAGSGRASAIHVPSRHKPPRG
jgi:hypothetical protein